MQQEQLFVERLASAYPRSVSHTDLALHLGVAARQLKRLCANVRRQFGLEVESSDASYRLSGPLTFPWHLKGGVPALEFAFEGRHQILLQAIATESAVTVCKAGRTLEVRPFKVAGDRFSARLEWAGRQLKVSIRIEDIFIRSDAV